jgi:hypothetical protein
MTTKNVAAFPSQDEIVLRARSRQRFDMFGFEYLEYLDALDYESATEFLTDEARADKSVKEDWKPNLTSRESVLERMKDYLPFAFEKARNQRGLSAMRSLKHFTAWTWLAGDRGLSEAIATYPGDDYGLAMLGQIATHYGWAAP